jgi:hypothetical protein
MFRDWAASDPVAVASVAAALIAIVVTVVTSVGAVRRSSRDRHLAERVAAYAEFLVTQDARFDAYDRTRWALGRHYARIDP